MFSPNLQTRTRVNRPSTLIYHIIQDNTLHNLDTSSYTRLHKSTPLFSKLRSWKNIVPASNESGCAEIPFSCHVSATRKSKACRQNRFKRSTKSFCLGGGWIREETALLVGKPPKGCRLPSRLISRRGLGSARKAVTPLESGGQTAWIDLHKFGYFKARSVRTNACDL